jgi:hypothetical protein
MRRASFIILGIFIFAGVFFIYEEIFDTFSVKNISFDGESHPEWSLPPLSPVQHDEINAILSKPFAYLGKGHQTYAFVSDDQQFVLKFIKFTYLKPSSTLGWLPSLPAIKKYRERQQKWKQKRFLRVFAGYRLAYEANSDRTGIVYVHLVKSNDLNKVITVTDRFGLNHQIDLDQAFFIVQRKGVMTREALTYLLTHQDVAGAKQKIQQIFDLYLDEYKKGLTDSDHNVMYNTGFVGEKAIHIDVGRMTQNQDKDPEKFKTDLKKIAQKRFGKWLKANYPDYYAEIHLDMEQYLTTIFNTRMHE